MGRMNGHLHPASTMVRSYWDWIGCLQATCGCPSEKLEPRVYVMCVGSVIDQFLIVLPKHSDSLLVADRQIEDYRREADVNRNERRLRGQSKSVFRNSNNREEAGAGLVANVEWK